MKNLLFAFAILIAPIAKADYVSVEFHGEEASKVFRLLEQSGAKVFQAIESASVTVRNAEVDYVPQGFVYSQFHATDDRDESVSLYTDAAFELFGLLEKAGARVQASNENGIESFVIAAKQIKCSVGYQIGKGPYQFCRVTQ